jgi:hypothetical protein
MTAFTEEHKKRISMALKGKLKPWLQKEKTEITCPCGNKFLLTPGRMREKHGKYCSRPCFYKYMKLFNVSALSHELRGNKHWSYKGNKAGYKAFHLRVGVIRGKATICSECGSTKRVEWANITKKYEDIYDYKELCKKCHVKFDDIANRVAAIKRSRYNLSDIARKGWVTRRGGVVSA